jgi:hypothetical protein
MFTRPSSGEKQSLGCASATITAEYFRLRCEGPQGSSVRIDGRFLKRAATTRSDVPVVSAIVTIRSGSGEVLYNARDRFEWHP